MHNPGTGMTDNTQYEDERPSPALNMPLMTPRSASQHLSAIFGLHPTGPGEALEAGVLNYDPGEMLAEEKESTAENAYPLQMPQHQANLRHGPAAAQAPFVPPLPATIRLEDVGPASGITRRRISPVEGLKMKHLSRAEEQQSTKLDLPAMSPTGSWYRDDDASGDTPTSDRAKKRNLSVFLPCPNGPALHSEGTTPSLATSPFGIASSLSNIDKNNGLKRQKGSPLASSPAGTATWNTWMPLGSATGPEADGQDYLEFNNDQFGAPGDGLMTPSGFLNGTQQFTLPSPTNAELLSFSARALFPKTPRDNEPPEDNPDSR
jgi:hypothetical protein